MNTFAARQNGVFSENVNIKYALQFPMRFKCTQKNTIKKNLTRTSSGERKPISVGDILQVKGEAFINNLKGFPKANMLACGSFNSNNAWS